MVYGIGDLHLDYSKEKPMDVFGEKWSNHEDKIFNNWRQIVKDDDLVLLPGDISWALKLEEAYYDLKRIDELPGLKIVTKGNHDYWWQGPKKLRELNLESITFLQNTSYVYRNIGIGGSRGWISEDSEGFDSHDEKIFNRELNRLKLSLASIDSSVDIKIAMLHYPPFNMDSNPNKFVDIMKEYDVDICIYGHLHAEGHRFVVEDEIDGIQFYCVSSDYIDFKPKKLV
ncbi:MAG: serine/threonine protein phosphatase [Tissierellia bacterium]|nr:serine/threonine protein phosphatase [Tissierellia bacterium]